MELSKRLQNRTLKLNKTFKRDSRDDLFFVSGVPDDEQDQQRRLWGRFLKIAKSLNAPPLLLRNLETFMVEGTAIRKNSKGNYVLRPVVGGGSNWASAEDYERGRDKCLRPNIQIISAALKILKDIYR